jgi:membrane protein DedA with SNARE-associated domain
MDGTIGFLLAYGYGVLFVSVLAEQVGLPVPAVPVLLGVGALAGGGRMSGWVALGVAVAASLPPDLVWYELGRRRGSRVLGVLCRVSLEPDSCVRRTENLFMRQGRRTLVIAKFLPGLSTIAPPLAGIVGVSRGQFLFLDGLGALIWSGTWIALGYLATDAIEVVAAEVARLGNWMLAVAGAGLGCYVLVKYVRRRRFLWRLRMARIMPEELKRRLEEGDGGLAVIDARSSLDVSAVPYRVPGARWIAAEEIDRRGREIPSDRDIVLYCS